MSNRYTFVARKSLTLIVSVCGEDESGAEGKAYEQVGGTPLDEWDGADEDDELELLDTDEAEEDQADQ